jgi:2-iminobutanoate/2-iminopropanoate deaminase
MTQPMPRMSLLSTILIFMITAVSISSAQQTKVISPPEFANQGKDDLPFSPGILVGDTLYVSGEIGFDLHTGQIPKDFDAEVKACLDNIGIVLKAAGMDHSNVVPAQVFLTDTIQFKRMNVAYVSVFKTPRPARVSRRRRGARRAHCSCRDHGHRPAAGLEELTAAALAWATFRSA